MVWARLGRLAANALMVAMLAIASPEGGEAQEAAGVDALNTQVVQLYGQGKYKEAAAVAENALAVAGRTLGPEHPYTLRALSNLALIYDALGRYGEFCAALRARPEGEGNGYWAGMIPRR